MQEDKREKVRKADLVIPYDDGLVHLASDAILNGTWQGLARTYLRATPEQISDVESQIREKELEEVRERARLTVLNLTARDKRFLRALKIAF